MMVQSLYKDFQIICNKTLGVCEITTGRDRLFPAYWVVPVCSWVVQNGDVWEDVAIFCQFRPDLGRLT